MTGDIRILVVGKPNLMRDGLWALLRVQSGFVVLPAIESDADAIGSVASNPAPDLALLHATCLGGPALGAIAALRHRWPHIGVLVLTPLLDSRLVGMAAGAGIHGYILESETPAELLFAIRRLFNAEHRGPHPYPLRTSTVSVN